MRKKNPIQFSKRNPSEVSKILEGTLGAYRIKDKVEQYSGFARWPEIVGADISRVAVPEKILRGRILVVRVLDAAWVQELTMMKSELIERLFQANFGAAIEDIKFLTGSPKTVGGGER